MPASNEVIALTLGGDRLVKFFDLINIEQRKRWNAPDWRTQKLIDADLVNWQDVGNALKLLEEQPA